MRGGGEKVKNAYIHIFMRLSFFLKRDLGYSLFGGI